jgi:DNA gyrase subunit A
MRATWEKGPATRATQTLYITSIPYGVNKAELVEAIAEVVISRKMPLLIDVKDISTDDVRIELQVKKEAEIDKVMAFLFKHTLLQTNFNVNLTCLIPTDQPEVCRPERLGLKPILWHFLHFRLEVVTRRLAHELEQLLKRIHTLEGFAFAFDILDDLIKIIIRLYELVYNKTFTCQKTKIEVYSSHQCFHSIAIHASVGMVLFALAFVANELI